MALPTVCYPLPPAGALHGQLITALSVNGHLRQPLQAGLETGRTVYTYTVED